MTTMTATDAIARSISHDEIVTIAHTRAAADDLLVACDDDAEAQGRHEYWGTEDGRAWRVHLHHACRECGDDGTVYTVEGWCCDACAEPRTDEDA